jgi:hypothetical protein
LTRTRPPATALKSESPTLIIYKRRPAGLRGRYIEIGLFHIHKTGKMLRILHNDNLKIKWDCDQRYIKSVDGCARDANLFVSMFVV